MREEEYIKNIHSEILEIMDYIDNICRENHFKYYLTGGSLLGAIRHDGFIPWDDDLDIEMPRQDYEQFLLRVKEDNKYDVLSYDTDLKYPKFFAKISKRNTKFIEDDTAYEWGIFVDIFPIDGAKSYGKYLGIKKKVVRYLLDNKNRVIEKDKRRIIKYYISRILSVKSWLTLMKKIAIDNSSSCNYYINYGSQYSVLRKTMPKAWYGNGTDVLFDGRYYSAPAEYKKVLNRIFGLNYMEIPPIEKRKTHYPLYVMFSNGEEMFFERNERKLTIEDTLK